MEHARRVVMFSDGTSELQIQRQPGGQWFPVASGPASRADDFRRGLYDVRTDTKRSARVEPLPAKEDR